MPEIHVTLLGRFAVTVGGVPVAEAGWKRRHAAAVVVVKVLALAPGRRLHREQVIDLVRPGDTTAAAVPKLHKAAHFARRAIGVPDSTAGTGAAAGAWPRPRPGGFGAAGPPARRARRVPAPRRPADRARPGDFYSRTGGARRRGRANRTLIISGEAGAGKSSLLAAIAARATERGFLAGHGTAAPVEGAWPYAPVIEALDGVCRQDPGLLSGLAGPHRGRARPGAERNAGLVGRAEHPPAALPRRGRTGQAGRDGKGPAAHRRRRARRRRRQPAPAALPRPVGGRPAGVHRARAPPRSGGTCAGGDAAEPHRPVRRGRAEARPAGRPRRRRARPPLCRQPPVELVRLVTTLGRGVPFLVAELARRAVPTAGAGPNSADGPDWASALRASMFAPLRANHPRGAPAGGGGRLVVRHRRVRRAVRAGRGGGLRPPRRRPGRGDRPPLPGGGRGRGRRAVPAAGGHRVRPPRRSAGCAASSGRGQRSRVWRTRPEAAHRARHGVGTAIGGERGGSSRPASRWTPPGAAGR